MSKLKLITTALLLTILLIACSSDDENETEPEANDPATEEENNENVENNPESDDSESENSDNDTTESDNEEDSSSNSGEILSLGDTGAIESPLGDYEITFESFQFMDEIEGETSSAGVFVLMNAKVENTGEDTLEGNDLYTASLFTAEETRSENSFYDSINLMEGPIEPGETVEGQFIFTIEESDSYELIYNFGFSSIATELTWEFSADEASN